MMIKLFSCFYHQVPFENVTSMNLQALRESGKATLGQVMIIMMIVLMIIMMIMIIMMMMSLQTLRESGKATLGQVIQPLTTPEFLKLC